MQRILVGVDGSEGSRRALAWAVAHAATQSEAVVEAVLVAPPVGMRPYADMLPLLDVPMPVPETLIEQDRTAALRVLETAINEVIADVRWRDRIERTVTFEPHVAEALLRLAKGADLLVVGSRGVGGFRGLLLGSVSSAVTRHAPCPVVVVPAVEH